MDEQRFGFALRPLTFADQCLGIVTVALPFRRRKNTLKHIARFLRHVQIVRHPPVGNDFDEYDFTRFVLQVDCNFCFGFIVDFQIFADGIARPCRVPSFGKIDFVKTDVDLLRQVGIDAPVFKGVCFDADNGVGNGERRQTGTGTERIRAHRAYARENVDAFVVPENSDLAQRRCLVKHALRNDL